MLLLVTTFSRYASSFPQPFASTCAGLPWCDGTVRRRATTTLTPTKCGVTTRSSTSSRRSRCSRKVRVVDLFFRRNRTIIRQFGRDSVVVSTSAWHAGGPGSYPDRTNMVDLVFKTWLSTSGTWRYISLELKRFSEDNKHLVVTTLNASTERSAWRKSSEKGYLIQ